MLAAMATRSHATPTTPYRRPTEQHNATWEGGRTHP
jgi:hypothetical protein